jgi:hypothetical protein
LGGSWGLLAFGADRPAVPLVAGVVMAAVAIYIVTRPAAEKTSAE